MLTFKFTVRCVSALCQCRRTNRAIHRTSNTGALDFTGGRPKSDSVGHPAPTPVVSSFSTGKPLGRPPALFLCVLLDRYFRLFAHSPLHLPRANCCHGPQSYMAGTDRPARCYDPFSVVSALFPHPFCVFQRQVADSRSCGRSCLYDIPPPSCLPFPTLS